jgi:hypothetical protein
MGLIGTKGWPTTVIDAGSSGSIWRGRVTGGSGAGVLLLSGSEDRTHASIYNHVNAALFIGYDHPAVSTSSFDAKLVSGSYFELPRPIWRGPVYGVWDAAGGVAMVIDISGSINS